MSVSCVYVSCIIAPGLSFVRLMMMPGCARIGEGGQSVGRRLAPLLCPKRLAHTDRETEREEEEEGGEEGERENGSK